MLLCESACHFHYSLPFSKYHLPHPLHCSSTWTPIFSVSICYILVDFFSYGWSLYLQLSWVHFSLFKDLIIQNQFSVPSYTWLSFIISCFHLSFHKFKQFFLQISLIFIFWLSTLFIGFAGGFHAYNQLSSDLNDSMASY